VIHGNKVLGLIPARGGSKRLERKNVLGLAGKPLIAWTITAANESKYLDAVVVSTDDDEISRVSHSWGAQVPFKRPEGFASDTATSNSVILHALDALEDEFDIVVLLQPTSPLRQPSHIDQALEQLVSDGGDGVISVTECEHPPLWANVLPDDGNLGGFLRTKENLRSQDLGAFYRLNGAVYAFYVNSLLENKGISYTEKVHAYIMPTEFSIDIDSELDFKIAEFLMKELPFDLKV